MNKLMKIANAAEKFLLARDVYNDGVDGRIMDLDSELLVMEVSERELRLAIADWRGHPDERLEEDEKQV